MAKAVPYICSSQLGEALLAGVQKVFQAASIGVEFSKISPAACASVSGHVLAGPLSGAATAEVADRLSLSSKLTSSEAAPWYPESIYPKLPAVTVRNLYSEINPSFTERAAPSPTAGIVPHDPNELSLLELRKEATRSINSFFSGEARDSIQDTMKVALSRAISNKLGDRSVVTVVHKPQGDLSTSTFDELIKGVAKSETDARADELRNSNISVEVTPVGSAWPKLVVFPESVGYVVCPSTKHGEQLESLLIGLTGGSGMVAQQIAGAKSQAVVHTCANTDDDENPTGILLASAELLTGLGMKEEAAKIVKALEKTYVSDKVLPASVPSGSAGLGDFVDAVIKNL